MPRKPLKFRYKYNILVALLMAATHIIFTIDDQFDLRPNCIAFENNVETINLIFYLAKNVNCISTD